MTNKEIEKVWKLAKRTMYCDLFSIQKLKFDCFLDAMILKIHQKYNGKSYNPEFRNNTPKVEENLNRLEEMKDFLELMTEKECIRHFQARAIIALERQLAKANAEKTEIIEEYENKIKMIETLNE